MKQTILLISSVFILITCTSKKTTSKSASTEPTDAQVTAARTKYPDATLETLNKGHGIYFGTCTRCHGAKEITSRSVEAWPGIIDRMAKKSALTGEEKDAVLQYVMGVKLASGAN